MRRSLDDVQQYFNMELGTTSNMAGDEATARLTIKVHAKTMCVCNGT